MAKRSYRTARFTFMFFKNYSQLCVIVFKSSVQLTVNYLCNLQLHACCWHSIVFTLQISYLHIVPPFMYLVSHWYLLNILPSHWLFISRKRSMAEMWGCTPPCSEEMIRSELGFFCYRAAAQWEETRPSGPKILVSSVCILCRHEPASTGVREAAHLSFSNAPHPTCFIV
jgi:hypothetical protein